MSMYGRGSKAADAVSFNPLWGLSCSTLPLMTREEGEEVGRFVLVSRYLCSALLIGVAFVWLIARFCVLFPDSHIGVVRRVSSNKGYTNTFEKVHIRPSRGQTS